MPSSVDYRNVSKSFGEVEVIKKLNMAINEGEFVVLVGASGCGKSTLLRMLAGLEDITEGDIYIGDRRVNEVAPKDRDIAMVFQSYALYPHMNVYDNMAFGLKLRKTPKQEIERRVKAASEILGMQELLKRKPRALSGGQRQRVAVGRAIVRQPSVFLLDEPLSNLDAKLRVQARAEISQLQARLGTTMVYVTHDQVEAMTMGHRIAILQDGVLRQFDTPTHVYEHPADAFVAGFIGSPSMNLIPVDLIKGGDKLQLNFAGNMLDVPQQQSKALESYIGRKLILGMRPEHAYPEGHQPSSIKHSASMSAEIVSKELLGRETNLFTKVSDAEFTANSEGTYSGNAGDTLKIVMDMERAHFFDADTRLVIGSTA